jgi:hypothetical protein
MSFTLLVFVCLSIALYVTQVDSCSVVSDFVNPTIIEVWLSSKVDILTVKIDSGNAQNCRELDTGTKKLAFMDISCDAASHPWTPIIVPSDAFSFSIRDEVNTTTNISTDTYWANFLLTNDGEFELNLPYYIAPNFYAWFYSAAMDALYILTVDTTTFNETEQTIDEFVTELGVVTTDDLNVIFVAFNPNPDLGNGTNSTANDTASNDTIVNEYAVGAKLWTEIYTAADNLPPNSPSSWPVYFGQTLVTNYDPLYMFQLPAIIGSCDGAPWFTYDLLSDFYTTLMSSAAWTYKVRYIGDGFTDLDDRNQRAYGYSYSGIWWFDAGAIGDPGSYNNVSFTSTDLTNWWMIIWIVLACVLCCVCVCGCICFCRRRQKKNSKRRAHFTADV